MAREALAKEDRVLSENYFQHADHFTRVQNEQEKIRMAKVNTPSVEAVKPIKTEEETIKEIEKTDKNEASKKIISESGIKKVI
jgi:catalase